jgi:hypothetical protein
LRGTPVVLLEVLDLDLAHEVRRHDEAVVELDEWHPVEHRGGLTDLRLADVVLLHQDQVDVSRGALGLGDGGVEILLADQLLLDEVLELRHVALGRMVGGPASRGILERLGEPGDGVLEAVESDPLRRRDGGLLFPRDIGDLLCAHRTRLFSRGFTTTPRGR